MAKLRVLLTGATGYIAGQLLPAFRERYDLRLTDVRPKNRDGEPVEGVVVADLLDPDGSGSGGSGPGGSGSAGSGRDRVAALFSDVDVVVHCAYYRPPDAADRASSPGTGNQLYEAERRNVDLMQRVYQLAVDHGVRRVVAASTNQAAKWYEQPYFKGLRDRVDPEDYPRPDTFYGWAKAAYESLGFLYACGSLGPGGDSGSGGGVGRGLEVIQLRIVVPREIDGSLFVGRPRERYIRELAGYISDRDLRQLFEKSIETPDIADEYGVPFHIFYGVSANARTFWSIANARKVIGYAPQDDSEIRFADDIARILYPPHSD